MLSVTYTASEYLDLLLAETNAPNDTAIRLVVEGAGLRLEIDVPRSGDTTFDHLERVVLAIDEQVSEFLADRKLDVTVRDEKPELILIERLEE